MKGLIKGIIIGIVIIVLGLAIFLIALGLNGWHFNDNAGNFEIQTYECETDIGKINIDCDAGSVNTVFYDGDKIVVDYPVSEKYVSNVVEDNGTLYVTGLRKKHWYIFSFGTINFPTTTIKLPQSMIYDIFVDVDAGEVKLAGGVYGKIEVDIDAGHADVGDVTCTELNCNIDAGRLDVASVACGKLFVDIDAGAAKLNRIDCAVSTIDVDAGSINAAFVGDRSEYTITVKKSAGSCNIESAVGSTEKTISIDVDAGSVEIKFE